MTWETPIYIKPSTIRSLEGEIEDLESRISCLEDELKFERSQAEAADKALVLVWEKVPEHEKAALRAENDYLDDMFWGDGMSDCSVHAWEQPDKELLEKAKSCTIPDFTDVEVDGNGEVVAIERDGHRFVREDSSEAVRQ